MNTKEILERALEIMPNEFTSNQFARTARELGIPQRLIDNGIVGNFLSAHVYRVSPDARSWYKDSQKVLTGNIESAIALLKQNGYKVFKPVSDWQEI